jgi:hypothetical protein
MDVADGAAEGAYGVVVTAALAVLRGDALAAVGGLDVCVRSYNGVHLVLLESFSAGPVGLTEMRVLV